MEQNAQTTKSEPDLYYRSLKGGYWIISSRIAVNILGFIKSLFLFNYFLLNDLGIISAAVMMMEIMSTFTQTGFESALIQKKEDIRDYLDTAWTAGIFKGIFLFAVLFSAAPLLAMFRIPQEKVPLAIWAFRAMSICFLIQGFHNIGAVYFSKNLDFHKTFLLSAASSLTDIVLSISLVLILRSIWGVIAARLVSGIVTCIGTYVLSSYRPRLQFKPAKAGELWKYGRWIFGQNVLGYLLENGDDFFVWFYLGIQPLALYRAAYQFSNAPFMQINSFFHQVLFPAFSKLQDDPERLRQAYLKVCRVASAVAIPSCLLIFSLGPDFVRLFLPPRLLPMVPVLQILAFKGLLKSLSSVRVPFFQAVGKPNVLLLLMWLRVSVLCLTIYFCTRAWGIVGTAVSVTLVNILVNPVALLLMRMQYQYKIGEVLKQSLLAWCAGALMTLLVLGIKQTACPDANYICFFGLLIVGALSYLLILIGLDRYKSYGYRDMLREQYILLCKAMQKSRKMFM